MSRRSGRLRDGILGGFLIFVLPVLIVLAAAFWWWGNLGVDDALEMEEPRLEAPVE